MRLTEWPRMPFLSEELCGWIREHLETLGVDEIAIFAMEEGADGDGRRVMVATEMGLADYRYGPRASTARFAIVGRFYPWQAVHGVDLRVETSRLWALEHQTRWWLNIVHPPFRAATEDPELGRALADFAKVAVLMAEPAGGTIEEAPARRPDSRTSAPQRPVSGERPAAPAPSPQSMRPPADRPSAVAALGLDGLGSLSRPPTASQNGPGSQNGPPSPAGPEPRSGSDPRDGSGPQNGSDSQNGSTSDVQPVGPGTTPSASRPQS